MRRVISYLVCVILGTHAYAQTTFEHQLPVTTQELVKLNFPFADDILMKTWDINEVKVVATVTVEGRLEADLFDLIKESGATSLRFSMDEEKWKEWHKKMHQNDCCNCHAKVVYEVFLPKKMRIDAETISGSFELQYYGKELNLNTISGDIDLTIDPAIDLDFHAKTISGEVYSDLSIQFPNGNDGLRQIVGMDIEGRLNKGGKRLKLETISGNVYLRKG